MNLTTFGMGVNHTDVPLLQKNPPLAITYITILSVCGVSGTFGNILVIVSILATKKIRTIGNMFILNLAVADLLVCSVLDSSAVTGAILGKMFYDDRPVLCEVAGGLVVISCLASIAGVALVSFHRFVHICFSVYCDKLFTRLSTSVLIAVVWTITILSDVRYLLKWHSRGHGFDFKVEQCFYDRHANSVILKIFALLAFVAVTVSYSAIFCFVRSHRLMSQARQSDSIKLAHTSLVIVISVYVCIMPYTVVTIIDKTDSLGQEVYLLTIAIAYLSSSLNWMIYGLANQQFRAAFKNTLNSIKCWK
ncbi:melatonin receptor type 1A-like [Liolophura sinensis]|uniref:melatonin receptor type 1A-like n=1 Tax=Liolophura sinensis TaxID=3198878 RepID=UPI0031583AB8